MGELGCFFWHRSLSQGIQQSELEKVPTLTLEVEEEPVLSARTDTYKYSIFPQTIRDGNVLSDSLISSAEVSDDFVSKFTSLVRARD